MVMWHRCGDSAASYSSLTGTAMAFNKQVCYDFIWITETLAQWAASRPSLFHDIQKHFQYWSHFSGIKKKPWPVFLNGMSSIFWPQKSRCIYFEMPNQSKQLQKGSEYLFPDRCSVWCCWMWWAALYVFMSLESLQCSDYLICCSIACIWCFIVELFWTIATIAWAALQIYTLTLH